MEIFFKIPCTLIFTLKSHMTTFAPIKTTTTTNYCYELDIICRDVGATFVIVVSWPVLKNHAFLHLTLLPLRG